MGQALYRTYRSKKLSEIVGQEHVTTALTHALEKGTISHAYLFTGPRGVGKTSIARILAHEINELPYDEDRQHLDIIEIDAASNRRIDEIRDLRDKVHIAPSSAKYKVYIIDEVHMLTKEAFNALLKTLEEPPAHVVFILATTEAHKLPETIISRTQRYAFKPVELPKVIAHLKEIAKQEKISISDDALALIAAHGEGSFRDSISLLDQVRNSQGKVELSDVQAVLGIAPAELVEAVVTALAQHDALAVAKQLKTMHDQGYEAAQVAKQLSGSLRKSILAGNSALSHETLMRLLGQLLQVQASPDPRVALEICLLDAALHGTQATASAATAKPETQKVMSEEARPVAAIQIEPKRKTSLTNTGGATEPAKEATTKSVKASATESSPATGETVASEPTEPTPPTAIEQDTTAAPAPTAHEALDPEAVDSDMILTEEAWELILNALKTKYNTLYSIAKMATPHFKPGEITLEFSYQFHQKRFNETRNKEKITEIIRGVTGSEVHISCILGEGRPLKAPTTPLPPADGEMVHNAAPANATPASETPIIATATASSPSTAEAQATPIDAISNIFGGAELLES